MEKVLEMWLVACGAVLLVQFAGPANAECIRTRITVHKETEIGQGITHKSDEQLVKHEVSEFSMEWNPNVELSNVFLQARHRDGGSVRICSNHQSNLHWAEGDTALNWHGAESGQAKYYGKKALGSPMKWTQGHKWVFDADLNCTDAFYGGTTNGESEYFLEARFVMGEFSNGDSWAAVREPVVTQRAQVCPGSALVNRRQGSHLLQDSHSVKCGVDNHFIWGSALCAWDVPVEQTTF